MELRMAVTNWEGQYLYNAVRRATYQSAEPRLHRIPDDRQEDSLCDGQVAAVDTPDDATKHGVSNVPLTANEAVERLDEGDDDLGNDDGDHGLPHRQADGDQRGADLPVADADLVDGLESEIGQFLPGTPGRGEGADVVVDPDGALIVQLGRDFQVLQDGPGGGHALVFEHGCLVDGNRRKLLPQ